MKKNVTYEQANELRNLGYEFPQSELVYQIHENGDIVQNKRSVATFYKRKCVIFCLEEVNLIDCPDTTDLLDAFFQVREKVSLLFYYHNVEDYHPTRFFKENRIEVVVHGKGDCKSFASAELVDNLVDALVWLKTKD